jgi:hypothetical protein
MLSAAASRQSPCASAHSGSGSAAGESRTSKTGRRSQRSAAEARVNLLTRRRATGPVCLSPDISQRPSRKHIGRSKECRGPGFLRTNHEDCCELVRPVALPNSKVKSLKVRSEAQSASHSRRSAGSVWLRAAPVGERGQK